MIWQRRKINNRGEKENYREDTLKCVREDGTNVPVDLLTPEWSANISPILTGGKEETHDQRCGGEGVEICSSSFLSFYFLSVTEHQADV